MNYASVTKQNEEDDAASLFGDAAELKVEKPEPPMMMVEPDILEILQKEKEMVGMYLSDHPLKRYEFELNAFTNCKLANLDDLVTECEREKKQMKVCVAGFINSVETKTSKSGKPYAKAVIEDFSGNYEMAFFGKDYETFMEYLKDHTAVFVEGEIREAYFTKPEDKDKMTNVPYKFKVKKISLLGNLSDSMISEFGIEVPAHVINPDFRKNLVHVLKSSKGNIPVSIYVDDPETKYAVEFISKKFQISVTADFIADVRDLGLRFKVSRKNAS